MSTLATSKKFTTQYAFSAVCIRFLPRLTRFIRDLSSTQSALIVASANEILVTGKPYNGNDRVFETVHDAVSSAEDGDVVLVYPGIYNLLSQSVCLDRAVTLRATPPRPADPSAAVDNTGVTLTRDFGVLVLLLNTTNGIIFQYAYDLTHKKYCKCNSPLYFEHKFPLL